MITVLLVDDSRVTREVTKLFLIARRDVTVKEARGGEEALKSVRAERADLIVADMQMPRMDGNELCLALKADPQYADIPVIILTSNMDPRARDQIRAAGALEVLSKPVEPKDLLAAMNRALGSRFPV